jgi:hypothetical protein
MNFLSHALPYRNRPVVAVATGTPDWLSLIDRKIRARRRGLLPHLDSPNPMVREVATGILAHIDDDQWFHTTESFVELNLFLAMQLREILPGDEGFRPMFVGHILIEVMLDGFWIAEDRSHAELYYESIEALDAVEFERAVNVITGKPTDQLVGVMARYVEAKFLYDYLDPTKLLFRLNQVMSRVGLALLPDSMVPWIEKAEAQVRSRRERLLTPPGHISIDFPPMAELA